MKFLGIERFASHASFVPVSEAKSVREPKDRTPSTWGIARSGTFAAALGLVMFSFSAAPVSVGGCGDVSVVSRAGPPKMNDAQVHRASNVARLTKPVPKDNFQDPDYGF